MNVSKRIILAINGSASKGSSNLRLIEFLASQNSENFTWEIVDELSQLPHFSPELSLENTPESILAMRKRIENADAVLICTPEYIFSIPSGLKNLIEWCVSTVIFDKKPTGIITASASGEKGHEELQLIMRTVGAVFMPETTLLIQGIKGKIDAKGVITDDETIQAVRHFLQSFTNHVNTSIQTDG
ncbi:MAG: NADPH-dependent FMN reductase [Candidatus Kapaibacteriota bacterium]